MRQRQWLRDSQIRLHRGRVKKHSRVKIHILDTRQLGRAGIVAATALETNEGIALFDTGPESSFDNLAAALRQSGSDPEDVRPVFLRHLHFDHAPSASPLATTPPVYHHPLC